MIQNTTKKLTEMMQHVANKIIETNERASRLAIKIEQRRGTSN